MKAKKNFDAGIAREIALHILKDVPYGPFMCLPMSALFYATISDNFHCDIKFVTGDLHYNDEYIFKQDVSLDSYGDNPPADWPGHAWVEIDDIICDLSFFRTLYAREFQKPFKYELINIFGRGKGILFMNSDELKEYGLFYHAKSTISEELTNGIIQGIAPMLSSRQ